MLVGYHFSSSLQLLLHRHGTQVFNQRHQTSREDHAQRKWIGGHHCPEGTHWSLEKAKEKSKDSSDVSKPTKHAIRPDISPGKNCRLGAIDSQGQDDKRYVGTNTAECQSDLDHFQKQASCEVGTFLASRNARYRIVQKKKKRSVKQGYKPFANSSCGIRELLKVTPRSKPDGSITPQPAIENPSLNHWSIGWMGEWCRDVKTWHQRWDKKKKEKENGPGRTPGRGDKRKKRRAEKQAGTPSVCTRVKGILNYTSIISASSAKISSAGPQLPSKTVAPARRRWLINCTP